MLRQLKPEQEEAQSVAVAFEAVAAAVGAPGVVGLAAAERLVRVVGLIAGWHQGAFSLGLYLPVSLRF